MSRGGLYSPWSSVTSPAVQIIFREIIGVERRKQGKSPAFFVQPSGADASTCARVRQPICDARASLRRPVHPDNLRLWPAASARRAVVKSWRQSVRTDWCSCFGIVSMPSVPPSRLSVRRPCRPAAPPSPAAQPDSLRVRVPVRPGPGSYSSSSSSASGLTGAPFSRTSKCRCTPRSFSSSLRPAFPISVPCFTSSPALTPISPRLW